MTKSLYGKKLSPSWIVAGSFAQPRLHPDTCDFKTPFEAKGKPWSMDRDKIWDRPVVAKQYNGGNSTSL